MLDSHGAVEEGMERASDTEWYHDDGDIEVNGCAHHVNN